MVTEDIPRWAGKIACTLLIAGVITWGGWVVVSVKANTCQITANTLSLATMVERSKATDSEINRLAVNIKEMTAELKEVNKQLEKLIAFKDQLARTEKP